MRSIRPSNVVRELDSRLPDPTGDTGVVSPSSREASVTPSRALSDHALKIRADPGDGLLHLQIGIA